MFGGARFLLNGNMAVGLNKEDLIVRVDSTQHDQFLKEKHARNFDLSGGRLMKGWLLISPGGVKN